MSKSLFTPVVIAFRGLVWLSVRDYSCFCGVISAPGVNSVFIASSNSISPDAKDYYRMLSLGEKALSTSTVKVIWSWLMTSLDVARF